MQYAKNFVQELSYSLFLDLVEFRLEGGLNLLSMVSNIWSTICLVQKTLVFILSRKPWVVWIIFDLMENQRCPVSASSLMLIFPFDTSKMLFNYK